MVSSTRWQFRATYLRNTVLIQFIMTLYQITSEPEIIAQLIECTEACVRVHSALHCTACWNVFKTNDGNVICFDVDHSSVRYACMRAHSIVVLIVIGNSQGLACKYTGGFFVGPFVVITNGVF